MVGPSDTVDPFSARPPPSAADAEPIATMEVFFHSSLGRIGDRADLCSASGDAQTEVGRELPAFVSPTWVASGLFDPCISRVQCTVGWSGKRGAFRVVPHPDAKREVRATGPDGTPLDLPSDALPPGTELSFGDRIVLLLTLRPAAPGPELGLVGTGDAMTEVRRRIPVLAAGTDTVLVLGETGTGKELVARALHDAGPRRREPFLALNCAALPENLVESELFGFVKGAFSGALAPKQGLFQAAQGGTLFLDEIGELSLGLQAKLLRVLEVRRVRPVGATTEEPFRARVVCATHRNLDEDVEAGRFRADLYARIEAPRVVLPPLRERSEDVPVLLAHFLSERARAMSQATGVPVEDTALGPLFRPADPYPPVLPAAHVLALVRHDWPRNVRELAKHCADVEAALVGKTPLPSPPAQRTSIPSSAPTEPRSAEGRSATPSDRPRAKPTKEELEDLLDKHTHNQAEVARALGVPYATLDRWLREAGVVRPKDLGREEILAAQKTTGGDLNAMAKHLRVSVRGLRARLAELGM